LRRRDGGGDGERQDGHAKCQRSHGASSSLNKGDEAAGVKLYHLIGNRGAALAAECLGAVEIDHELEFGGLHDRQIGGLLALADEVIE